jgi:CheY-like chemotaxis protein
MALADTFQQVVDSLPGDWTDLELDLRIDDESRYIDAALYLVTCNAQPYSRYDWHWRLLVAHSFGHAAAVPAVHGALKLLDDAGITGELAVREVLTGALEAWDEVGGIDLLVIDLTSPDVDGIELFESLATGGELHGVRSLGFFAHVEPEVRKRALQAGFDLVVPRSRMAREGADLVAGLLAQDGG